MSHISSEFKQKITSEDRAQKVDKTSREDIRFGSISSIDLPRILLLVEKYGFWPKIMVLNVGKHSKMLPICSKHPKNVFKDQKSSDHLRLPFFDSLIFNVRMGGATRHIIFAIFPTNS